MLTALALKLGVSKRLLTAGLILLGVIAAVIAFNVWLSGEKKDAVKADRDKAVIEDLKADAKADENAAEQRGQDAARINQEAAQLKEATREQTDPAAARRAHYACVRLQQRARAAGIEPPACR